MMSSSLWAKCVYLLCLSWPLLLAGPIRHTRTNQNPPTDTRDDHSLLQYNTTAEDEQTVAHPDLYLPRYLCTTARDCYPRDLVNDTIPEKFVNCTETRTCTCSHCFYNLNDSCVLQKCHSFENRSEKCVDHRKSQKDIFIYSFFLSSIGYANFAIGQNVLGAVQLCILFLSCLCCCCACCTKACFRDCCDNFSYECECCDCCEEFWGCCCHDICSPLFILFSALVTILSILTIISWWVVDLVVFSENSRLDSDGCPLKYDL